MEIIPKIGIDLIQFGVSESEAIEILGAPDKSFILEGECKRVQFNRLFLELSFEPENENRLGWLEVHNTSATLFKAKIIGLAQSLVLSLISDNIAEAPEVEDYGSFISYFYSENLLELQFQFGVLKCVNLGVPYNEEGFPIWPNT